MDGYDYLGRGPPVSSVYNGPVPRAVVVDPYANYPYTAADRYGRADVGPSYGTPPIVPSILDRYPERSAVDSYAAAAPYSAYSVRDTAEDSWRKAASNPAEFSAWGAGLNPRAFDLGGRSAPKPVPPPTSLPSRRSRSPPPMSRPDDRRREREREREREEREKERERQKRKEEERDKRHVELKRSERRGEENSGSSKPEVDTPEKTRSLKVSPNDKEKTKEKEPPSRETKDAGKVVKELTTEEIHGLGRKRAPPPLHERDEPRAAKKNQDWVEQWKNSVRQLKSGLGANLPTHHFMEAERVLQRPEYQPTTGDTAYQFFAEPRIVNGEMIPGPSDLQYADLQLPEKNRDSWALLIDRVNEPLREAAKEQVWARARAKAEAELLVTHGSASRRAPPAADSGGFFRPTIPSVTPGLALERHGSRELPREDLGAARRREGLLGGPPPIDSRYVDSLPAAPRKPGLLDRYPSGDLVRPPPYDDSRASYLPPGFDDHGVPGYVAPPLRVPYDDPRGLPPPRAYDDLGPRGPPRDLGPARDPYYDELRLRTYADERGAPPSAYADRAAALPLTRDLYDIPPRAAIDNDWRLAAGPSTRASYDAPPYDNPRGTVYADSRGPPLADPRGPLLGAAPPSAYDRLPPRPGFF